MGKAQSPESDDLVLGQRDSSARDPETFDAFLGKARKLGFSAREIAALKALYAPGKTDLPPASDISGNS